MNNPVRLTPLKAAIPSLPDRGRSPRAHAVVIAIDVSPSMDERDYPPSRLEGAKSAARRYLATMASSEPDTLVGIIDFHGEAELVAPPVIVGVYRAALQSALLRLHTGSNTNIGAGLELAAHELALVGTPASPTVILLTDGESFVGPDPVAVATKLKAQGIQLDIVGIGGSPAEVNERDLKCMASVINGQRRYWFIESVDALVERFEALALREIR